MAEFGPFGVIAGWRVGIGEDDDIRHVFGELGTGESVRFDPIKMDYRRLFKMIGFEGIAQRGRVVLPFDTKAKSRREVINNGGNDLSLEQSMRVSRLPQLR